MAFKRKLYTDQELLAKLKDGTLPPADFTHEAHIRLVWILRNQESSESVYSEVSQIIKNYANAIGEGHIYHETLTYAAVMITLHFIAKTKADEFYEFIEDNLDLMISFKELIEEHYSQELLQLPQAKTQILPPDRKPF